MQNPFTPKHTARKTSHQQPSSLPGPPPAARGRESSAASQETPGAGTGRAIKTGHKRRNAQEIAVLVEQRRSALKAQFHARGLEGIMWKATQRPGTPEAKVFTALMKAINAQFPTIRGKKEEKGKDKGQHMLTMQFKALCRVSRAKRSREGDRLMTSSQNDNSAGPSSKSADPRQNDRSTSSEDDEDRHRHKQNRTDPLPSSAPYCNREEDIAAQDMAQAQEYGTVKVVCRCGAVELMATMNPSRVFCCHCSDCQRLTGSDYAHLAWFRPEQLVTIRGASHLTTWQPGSDSMTWHHCSTCVTRLYASRTDPDNPTHVMRKVIGVGSVISKGEPRSEAWTAQEHIFYSERVVDVEGGCPKWERHRGSKLIE